MPVDHTHRRRIYTEEKAKVVADVWGTEFIPFLATRAIFHRDDLKNSSFSSYHPGAINHFLHIILVQNSKRGKELNTFGPPNRSDDLFLVFCVNPSSMTTLYSVLVLVHTYCTVFLEINQLLIPFWPFDLHILKRRDFSANTFSISEIEYLSKLYFIFENNFALSRKIKHLVAQNFFKR